MTLRARPLLVAAALSLGAVATVQTLRAQGAAPRAERLARLDPAARAAVTAAVDSALAAHLPTEPLVDKALEGAEKGADGARIVAAVRSLAAEMRTSREALGAGATADEIAAGANALHAGLTVRDIARLRVAAHRAGRQRLTVPLTVATDLVARAVPAAAATAVVTNLTRAGAGDGDLAQFQRDVRLDIERGADPATAAETRARGEALHLEHPR